MKQLLLLLTLIGFTFNENYAQESDPALQLDTLSIEITALKKQIIELQNSLQGTNRSLKAYKYDYARSIENQNLIIDSLAKQLAVINQGLTESLNSLNRKLAESDKRSESDISELKGSLSNNTIYWIIATSFAVLLAVILFVLLRKSIKTNEQKTMRQLQNTRKALEEEGTRLDNKLIELLEKQLTISETVPQPEVSEVVDHSLALKVADEVVRIQKNLSMMNDDTRGKKQLSASVERILSNFEANGYEIVDMLNKPYYEGMKVQASFRPDDTLGKGQQIITRVIKPQVNYNGLMIQPAHIEVNQGI